MSKHDAPPTLDDVAKKAGVSSATVSRCLNDPTRVAEETRTRVMEAVEVLGYTPNFAARVMAAKRTFTIGAIVPTMENSIFARGLQAFQEELRAKGYTLLVSSSAYEPDVEREQIKTLVARGADGLLLIGHERDPEIYEYLERQKIPTLVAWSFDPEARVPTIGFDNQSAMYALASQAIHLGHRDIAMISGASQGNDRARLRIEGLKLAMDENGLNPAQIPVIETSYEVESGAAGFERLMSHSPRPTAVLCGNDVLAVGALKRAREMGVRVPQDVSITGFDDMDLAVIVSPALTTIEVPHGDMGREAARELVDMVEGKSEGKSKCLPTKVISRQSLAGVE